MYVDVYKVDYFFLFVSGCNITINKPRYYSQCQEDRALFETYFSSPVICQGVYLEIGALDGVKYSNTKFFEDQLGWTGVLIEAQPENAEKLKQNRPKSIVIQEAVCSEEEKFVKFSGVSAVGGIPDLMTDRHKHKFRNAMIKPVQVPCRPMRSMLKEAGIQAIDFFILDVEGAELKVLETMDWDIPVKSFVVEMGRGEQDDKVIQLLNNHGYKKAQWNIRSFCKPRGPCANNQVFEHPHYIY